MEDDHHSCLFCSSLATAYGPIHTQFQLNVVVPGQPNVAHGILKRHRFKFHMLYAMVYVVSFSVCIFVLGFFLLDTIQTTSFYDPIFTCLTFYIFFFGLLLLLLCPFLRPKQNTCNVVFITTKPKRRRFCLHPCIKQRHSASCLSRTRPPVEVTEAIIICIQNVHVVAKARLILLYNRPLNPVFHIHPFFQTPKYYI